MQRGKRLNRILDFYLGVPVLNLIASFRRRRSLPERPKRIGLLLNPALGDTLLASAAAQDLRSTFPAAELILFATEANVSAARLLPAIDAIVMLPITSPIRAMRTIRRRRLDLMVDFTSWQRLTALYTLLSGARCTAGFERAGQFRSRGYDSTAAHRGDCHELDNLRRLTRLLGARTASSPRVIVPGGRIPAIVIRHPRLTVFHAWASGAHNRLREWPEEYWAALASRLMALGRLFVLTGAPADEERCRALGEKLAAQGAPVEVLIGRDGLNEVARVLAHAEMLVSVNTGIMHLGAILGTPTVAINGPTSVRRWGATGANVVNVCPADGSGGFLDLGFEYRGHRGSVMNRIAVEDVVRAIGRLHGADLLPDAAREAPATANGELTPMALSGQNGLDRR